MNTLAQRESALNVQSSGYDIASSSPTKQRYWYAKLSGEASSADEQKKKKKKNKQ